MQTQLRGHHLVDLHIFALLGFESPKLKKFTNAYSKGMWEYKVETYRKLIEFPESAVELVAGLDFLCKDISVEYECPRLRIECANERSVKIDIYYADKYGLNIGTIYNSGSIVELLMSTEYRSINGVIQPILKREL